MQGDRFEFWAAWLFWACVGTAALGVVLVFFDTRLLPWLPGAVNQAVWQTDTMPADVVTYHRFMHAVLGSTIVSWAAVLAIIARHPFRRREPWAWWTIVIGLVVWFSLDTTMSLYFGVWPNAVFNASAVLFVGIPLVFTRSAFRKAA